MKITKKLVLLLLACLLSFAPICLASNDIVTTSDDNDATNSLIRNITNTDLYILQDDVVIEDAINGNVFVLGSNVTIKGEIAGDLFVLANTLTIENTATIYNNIFALANTFIMEGNAYDIYALANAFELSESGYVYRDMKVGATSIKLNGLIRKDVYILSENISIPESSDPIVGGNFYYTSSQELDIPDGLILGEVQYTKTEEKTITVADVVSSYVTSFVTTMLYAIVVILIATFFAPKFIEKSNYTLMKKPFITAGIGILSVVLIPIAAIVMLITGVLTYVAFATIAIYALALSITLPIFSLAIAKSVESKFKTTNKGRFIGFSILSAAILWLLQQIPFIGGYASLFIYVVGLGIFLFSCFMRKDVTEANK